MSVMLDHDVARVRFERFALEAYRLFLRCKAIPEKRLSVDERSGAYTIETPRRFAAMLDPSLGEVQPHFTVLAPHLFDYVAEFEGMVFENLRAKEARFMAEAGEQEAAYLAAMRKLGAVA